MAKRDFEPPATPLSRKELIIKLGHAGFIVEEAQELADKLLKIKSLNSTTDFRHQIELMSREQRISKESVRTQFARNPQAFLSWQPAPPPPPKPLEYGFPATSEATPAPKPPVEETAEVEIEAESPPALVVGDSDTSAMAAIAAAEAFAQSSGTVILIEPTVEKAEPQSARPARTISALENTLLSPRFYEAAHMVGQMAAYRAQREAGQKPSNRQQRRAAEAQARQKGHEPK